MNYEEFFKAATKFLTHDQATVIYNESEFLALLSILKKKGLITQLEFEKELGEILAAYAKQIRKM